MRTFDKWIAAILTLSASGMAAADALTGEVQKQPLNIPAIVMFFLFVLFTLGITVWASKQNKSTKDYYTAGGGISGFQNGWRLRVTICRQRLSLVFRPWCLPVVTTV